MEPYDVFLSYSGADSELASWLHSRLEASGLRVYFDQCDLVPGTAVGSGLADAVRRSKYFVPLVTANLGERQWPRYEIESALAHAPFGKVIPVVYGVGRDAIPDVLRPFSPLILARDTDATGDPVDVLIAVLNGDDVPAVRRRLRDPRPIPSYPDAKTRDAGDQLRALYRERALREADGQDTRAETAAILALRRANRSGPQLRAGDQLGEGRFELLEIVGSGGFATVWKTYDARDERVVALKLIHGQHLRDQTMVERFFRGAKTMASLRHPGVVSVVEARGEEDGYLYFVMEYLTGGDLRRAVVEGRLGGVEALHVLLVVGEALEYAHTRGYVHRDVKPDNILLDRVGGPRLTDFDLVKGIETTGATLAGAGLGTFLYAAPEARFDAAEASATADVFSLGMTALFIMCGRELPPRASGRPEEVLEGLTGAAALRRAVARAIAFEPSQRYPSVQHFCDALREALDSGEPNVGIPASAPVQPAPLWLEARDVHLAFGSHVVVRDLSLAIRRGEMVGLLGSHGSGIEALLRILGGRMRPSRGQVRLQGLPLEPARIGFVAADYAFAPELSVEELLRYLFATMPTTLTGDGEPWDTFVRATLDSVGLGPEIVSHRPDELSRGMRRRLAIAMEIAGNPDILFLEDATADLDSRQARQVVLLCRALSSRGFTVVMNMPALSDAEFQLFDRLVVLSRSELLWSGPPYEAVGWFERKSGTSAPLARTAVDFLHDAIASERVVDPAFKDTQEYEREVGAPLRRDATPSEVSRSTAVPGRVRALAQLYARQMRRRRAYLLVRLLQVPMIVAALDISLFDVRVGRALPSPTLAAALAIVAVWFGASGSAFEVLRERPFFLQQRSAGTLPWEYLTAKVPIQALLLLVQLTTLWFTPLVERSIIPNANGSYGYGVYTLHSEFGGALGIAMFGVLLCIGLAGAAHGLLVSAVFATRSGVRRRVPLPWLLWVALLSAALLWMATVAVKWMVFRSLVDIEPAARELTNVAVIIAIGVVGFASAVLACRDSTIERSTRAHAGRGGGGVNSQ